MSRSSKVFERTFCFLFLFVSLEPCSRRPWKDFCFMFNHVLTFFQLHLCFSHLKNTYGLIARSVRCERMWHACFSSFSSLSIAAISSVYPANFSTQFCNISVGTIRCRTWSSPELCLIAALSIFRSASPTRVTDLSWLWVLGRHFRFYISLPSSFTRTGCSSNTMQILS